MPISTNETNANLLKSLVGWNSILRILSNEIDAKI